MNRKSDEDKKNLEVSLSDTLSNGLLQNTLDLSIDYSELSLDALLNEGVMKEVPVVKTLVSIFKIGHSIRNQYFIKKFLLFLSQYHSHIISDDQLQKFKSQFSDDDNYREKVLESLIVIIDKIDSQLKTKMLADLFVAHINGQYDWDTFVDLSACIDRLMLADLKLMKYLGNLNKGTEMKNINIKRLNQYLIRASLERLRSYGFIDDDQKTGLNVKSQMNVRVFLSGFGSKFHNLCLRSLVREEFED